MFKIINSQITFFVFFILNFLFFEIFVIEAKGEEYSPLLRVELPSSPNPVGSGARALGMSAFIAIADDATAASWNPAGLAQLKEAEFSIVFDNTIRKEGICFEDHHEASHKKGIYFSSLNYMSLAFPLTPFNLSNRHMVISVNLQHLYEFNREWSFNYNFNNDILSWPVHHEYKQDGELYALGLAYSIAFENFSFGLTLNDWGKFIAKDLVRNQWTQTYKEKGKYITASSPDPSGIISNFYNEKIETFDFKGWNWNLGFIVNLKILNKFFYNNHQDNILDKISFGGIFKKGFTADLDHNIKRNTNSSLYNLNDMSIEKNTLKMPMSWGVGIKYLLKQGEKNELKENVRFTGDFYVTHWKDFKYEHNSGKPVSAVTGKESNVSNTTCIRIGAEKRFIKKDAPPIFNYFDVVSYRAGLFYDPEPSEGSPDDYYGLSMGFGLYYFGSNYNCLFDLAYQYRRGTTNFLTLNIKQKTREHKVYASLIYHFNEKKVMPNY